MKTNSLINIVCPVSGDKTNENASRIAAAITIIVTALSMYFDSFILIALLAADFALRAYSSSGNSPVKYITKAVVRTFNIKNKPIDAAQKRFAAELGFILSLAICLFQIFRNYAVADVMGFVLIFFAFLESALNLCVGCIIYTYFALPFLRKEKL